MARRRVALGLVLFAVVAAATALPAVVSSQLTEHKVAGLLSALAGRPVRWSGKPEISVFPRLEITLEDVTVLGGPGPDAVESVRIPTLRLSFKTLPLLWGQVKAGALTLAEPRIHIAAGAEAWSGMRSGLHTLFAVDAGTGPDVITLSNGVITYGNRVPGPMHEIHAAHLQLSRQRNTVVVAGRFVRDGRQLQIDAELDEPWELFSPAGTAVSLTLNTTAVEDADTEPAAAALPAFQVDGTFQLVRGGGESLVKSVRISDASLRIRDTVAHGTLAASNAGPRPRIEGNLAFDQLDFSGYVDAWLPDTLAELLSLPLSDRWLRVADVDLSLSASLVDFGGIYLEDTAIRVATRAGRMILQVENAGLVGGNFQGTVAVASAGEGLAASLAGRVDDVSLGQAAGHLRPGPTTTLIGPAQPPQGIGKALFDISGQGATVGGMLESLAGWADVDVRDGSLDGADTVSTLERVVDGGAGIAEGEAPFVPIAGRTHFSQLTARVVVSDRVARVERVHLAGERFEITVSGEIDLTGGEVTAQGSACLFEPEHGDEMLVELPFGVGGTLRDPMGAPGIPRHTRGAPAPEFTAIPPWPAAPRGSPQRDKAALQSRENRQAFRRRTALGGTGPSSAAMSYTGDPDVG